MMTQLLQQAYERAAALPQEDQDRLGRLLLAELESYKRRSNPSGQSESEGRRKLLDDELSTPAPSKTLEDLFGVFADGKPARSKSEEREISRGARSARYR
ncbi:MAG: hypothetical protein F4X14_13340 [Caldilineaceae bacterium SB0661_bin_32]|uniref:Uncharacterized protein n=1 Tax=Caldilineaceae bacterium SB0661_bin_32 TaxID=2605255 RepID=A0A6B1D8E1_9CHLR|nr:hypothetical protein [Caldilineaceae bacterium SB0661_bin_32]